MVCVQALKFTQSPRERSGWSDLALLYKSREINVDSLSPFATWQPGHWKRWEQNSAGTASPKRLVLDFSFTLAFPSLFFSNRTTDPKWTSRNKGWKLAALLACQVSAGRLWHRWRPVLCSMVSYLWNSATWTTDQREALPSTPTLMTGGSGGSAWSAWTCSQKLCSPCPAIHRTPSNYFPFPVGKN